MGPGRGEDPHLVRAQVRYHDASVRQPEGAADNVEKVWLLAFDRADRHRRFRPDSPPEAGAIGRAGVLGDQDACAVADFGSRQVRALGRLVPIQVLLAGGRGQCGDGRDDVNFHVSVTESKLDMTKCNSWLTSLRLSAPAVLKNPLYRSSGHTCTYST